MFFFLLIVEVWEKIFEKKKGFDMKS